jgi:hypothetical protein
MSAADAVNRSLVRIASLRHGDFDLLGRPLLRERREEEKPADHDDEDDDDHNQSRHACGFCRAVKPLYSLF